MEVLQKPSSSPASTLAVAILIVSTTVAAGQSPDSTGPKLKELLETSDSRKWAVRDICVVPDDLSQIQQQIKAWTDAVAPPSLILTSGGTGFALADITPEVSHCNVYLILTI